MEKELIKSLYNAISQIDGGCHSCIKSFIKDANLNFYKHGVIYNYVNDQLKIIDIEPKQIVLELIDKYKKLSQISYFDMECPSDYYKLEELIKLEFYGNKDF